MALTSRAIVRRHVVGGVVTTPPPSTVQHWYKIGEEGDTVTGVTGNVRLGTAREWSATMAVTNATIVATSANFGLVYDSSKTKQLQCDNEVYASRHLKIMPLGDSITANDTTNSGWRLLMQELSTWIAANKKPTDFVGNASINYNNVANVDFDHNGYSGYRASDLGIPAGSGVHPGWPNSPPYYGDARDLDDWFVGTAADIVILHMGTNDMAAADSSVSNSTVLNGYSLMLSRARQQNPRVHLFIAQIIGQGTQWVGGDARVQSLNAAIPGWATTNSTGQSPITVVDQYTGFDPATMTADGIHPNSTGALQMANRFFAAIEPFITVGATALERIQGWGMNIDWVWPGCYSQMFSDVIKGSSGFWVQVGSAASQDPVTGWPLGVAAGSTLRSVFSNTLGSPEFAYIRPGVYKARLPAAAVSAGWTCRLIDTASSGKITSGAAGTTATATVIDQGVDGDYSGVVFALDCYAPTTGGPYDFPGCEAYLQANEGWRDSLAADPTTNYYKIFNPELLADVAGIKCIRFKDWFGVDALAANVDLGDGTFYRMKRTANQWSEMVQESFKTWQMGGQSYESGQTPVSVCAKLANYLGCGVHLNLPLMHHMMPFDVVSGGTINVRKHGVFNGDTVVFNANASYPLPPEITAGTKYYVRDVVTDYSFRICATPGGPALALTNQAQSSNYQTNCYKMYTEAEIQAFYDRIAQEFYTYAPNADVIVDVGNENWSPPQPYGYDQCFSCLSHYTTANHFQAGSGYAWLVMRAWTAFEKYYPRNQVIRIYQGQGSYFNGMALNGYAYTDPTLYVGQTVGNLIDAHCCEAYSYASLTGKEPVNAHDDWVQMMFAVYGHDWGLLTTQYEIHDAFGGPADLVHMIDGNNYRCILPHNNQQPPNPTYWVQESTNGLVGVGKDWTDDQCLEYGMLTVQFRASAMRRYKTLADAQRTNPTPAGFVVYEGGFYLGNHSGTWTMTGANAFGRRWNAFMKTAKHQQFVQAYYEQMLRDAGVNAWCQYMFAGQWRIGTVGNSSVEFDITWFGLKRSHHEPDTPSSAYLKTLTSMA
jgi:lysophospholipase L1-like esterase